MNTEQPSILLAQSPDASWMRYLKMTLNTHSEYSLWSRVLILHHTPFLPLRPHASRCKLSTSQVMQTVQPSNTATNMSSGGIRAGNWCHMREKIILFTSWCIERCQQGMFTREWKISKLDRSKYWATYKWNSMTITPRTHKHHSSGASSLADVAVIVNINAEVSLQLIY